MSLNRRTYHRISLFLCVGFFGICCAPAPDNNPVAYWSFNEGRGTLAKDASGNGHDGSLKDAAWVRGMDGHALSFANGGHVEIPDHPRLRLESDFTIMAWIRKTKESAKGKSMGIVSKSTKDQWDYDLFMSTSKLEHAAFYSDAFQAAGGDIEVISSLPLSLNTWHHVAVTRRGMEGRLFIDGTLTGTASLPEKLTTSANNLFIGYDHDGSFGGVIDEVSIYDHALTDEEIRLASREGDNTLRFAHVVIDSAYGGIRAIANINRDSYPDFVHCYWYSGAPLSWYENKSAGTWSKHIIREDFYPVTDNFDAADMDGDGDPDVVLAKSDAKRSSDPNADNVLIDKVDIVWFENPLTSRHEDTTSWRQHDIGSHFDSNENYIKDIKATDFTGDGRPEVVIRSNVAVSIFCNANGKWSRLLYRDVYPHEGMDTGDVDCDGDADIVLNGFWLECPGEPLTQTWALHVIDDKWFLQEGDWTANNCKVYIKDINKDGCVDILLSHSERSGYPVSWYERDKANKDGWSEHVVGRVDFCHTLQAADMDLDGDVDVVTGEMEKSDDPDQITIFLNAGDAFSWDSTVTIDQPIYSGKVADMDNDGDPDILGNRNFNRPPLELWDNGVRD